MNQEVAYRVIAVEDENPILSLLGAITELEGHTFSGYARAEDALAQETNLEDVGMIIVDNHLNGGMDGPTYVKTITGRLELDRPVALVPVGIPIIMASGDRDLGDVSAFGATHFLPKPFDVDDLSGLMQQAANSYAERLRQALPSQNI